jgi:hypothetical protein
MKKVTVYSVVEIKDCEGQSRYEIYDNESDKSPQYPHPHRVRPAVATF